MAECVSVLLGLLGRLLLALSDLTSLDHHVNLDVHFHTLVPDRVFIEEGTGPARFETLNAPGDEELEAILARIVRRTAKVLERLEEDFELDGAKDALAGIQAEQVQQRLRHPEPFEPTRRSAFLEGYSLHAGVRVHGNDLQAGSSCAGTSCARRWPCTGCRARRTAPSSTG